MSQFWRAFHHVMDKSILDTSHHPHVCWQRKAK
jgi:hypothetical protein